MFRGSRRRLLWVSVSTLLSVACLSPTLPLPPPSEPTVEGPTAEGKVLLTGTVGERAHVLVANMRLRRSWGEYAGPDGNYALLIDAQAGDELVLWYEVGNEQSPSTYFTVPDAATDAASEE
jgi:CRISPR/Cas system-associated protein Cas5 (RAMP superfamily)